MQTIIIDFYFYFELRKPKYEKQNKSRKNEFLMKGKEFISVWKLKQKQKKNKFNKYIMAGLMHDASVIIL